MRLGYKNILVALDGSKEAEWAFKKAVNLAKDNNAKLLLVHVVDNKLFDTVAAYDDGMIIQKAEEFAKEMFESCKTYAVDAGVSEIQYLVEYGSPKVLISKEIAKKNNCDLIVCGATGLNAVERFFMGSVSEFIVRYAPCDVLIVRREEDIKN